MTCPKPHIQLQRARTRSRYQFLWLLIQRFFLPNYVLSALSIGGAIESLTCGQPNRATELSWKPKFSLMEGSRRGMDNARWTHQQHGHHPKCDLLRRQLNWVSIKRIIKTGVNPDESETKRLDVWLWLSHLTGLQSPFAYIKGFGIIK